MDGLIFKYKSTINQHFKTHTMAKTKHDLDEFNENEVYENGVYEAIFADSIKVHNIICMDGSFWEYEDVENGSEFLPVKSIIKFLRYIF